MNNYVQKHTKLFFLMLEYNRVFLKRFNLFFSIYFSNLN